MCRSKGKITDKCVLVLTAGIFLYRGSRFLKHWMDFLEENADLRYPDAGDLM